MQEMMSNIEKYFVVSTTSGLWFWPSGSVTTMTSLLLHIRLLHPKTLAQSVMAPLLREAVNILQWLRIFTSPDCQATYNAVSPTHPHWKKPQLQARWIKFWN